MKKHHIDNFVKGWLVGDFEPSIIRTQHFEFMVRYYKAGDKEVRHVHKVADEITVIITGAFRMNRKKLKAGDIVHLAPGQPADFECLVDGANAVIKTPSVIGDKYVLTN